MGSSSTKNYRDIRNTRDSRLLRILGILWKKVFLAFLQVLKSFLVVSDRKLSTKTWRSTRNSRNTNDPSKKNGNII